MSSRTRSDFGSLEERTAVTKQHVLPRHCLVDGRHPGVLLSWEKPPAGAEAAGWTGLVAYADLDCELHVSRLPAARLTPA